MQARKTPRPSARTGLKPERDRPSAEPVRQLMR